MEAAIYLTLCLGYGALVATHLWKPGRPHGGVPDHHSARPVGCHGAMVASYDWSVETSVSISVPGVWSSVLTSRVRVLSRRGACSPEPHATPTEAVA